MFTKKKLFIFFIFFTQMTLASYRTQTVKLKYTKLTLVTKKSWQLAESIYGHDISLFVPLKKNDRSIIIIDHVKVKKWSVEKEREATNSYLETQKNWIKKKKGKLINSTLNQKVQELNTPHIKHTLVYELDQTQYQSTDIIMRCGKEIVLNVSYLIPKADFKPFEKDWKKLISNLKCY